MKRYLKLNIVLTLLVLTSVPAFALPTLQLDISDAVYDNYSETVTATSETFTLYALLNGDAQLLADTYYISAAVISDSLDTFNPGSFTFNGDTITVSDMSYGVPPVESLLGHEAQDLPTHGVFPAYFTEFAFTFDESDKVGAYNSQDDPGGFDLASYDANSPSLYYSAFNVNTEGLLPGYSIHFDLYSTMYGDNDVEINIFAPFSHDAQSSEPVPEPASMLLLASGLVGLAGISKKYKLKKQMM